MAAALEGCFTLKGKVLNDIPPVRGWTCSIRNLSGWRFSRRNRIIDAFPGKMRSENCKE